MRAARQLVVLLALVVASCGGGGSIDAADEIPVQVPAQVEIGRVLYATSCASCHGADLRGTNRGPSHLSPVYRPSHHADVAFALAVKFGVPQHHWDFGPMAPVSGLDDAAIAAVTSFIREAQRTQGFEE